MCLNSSWRDLNKRALRVRLRLYTSKALYPNRIKYKNLKFARILMTAPHLKIVAPSMGLAVTKTKAKEGK